MKPGTQGARFLERRGAGGYMVILQAEPHAPIRARAEALGRTTQVWTIRIEDEEDRLVCISRFTVAVIPLERK